MSRITSLHTVILTTFAQISKVVSGFLLLKMLAYYLGSGGLGMLGNFMSLVAIAFMLSGGGIVNGVIKHVAEYKLKPKRVFSFIETSAIYTLIFTLSFLLISIIFSVSISKYIFGDTHYYWIVILLGFAQIGFGFANLVIGVVNGYSDTVTYAKLQVFGNILGLPLVYALLKNYGVLGAALGIIVFYFSYTLPAYYYYFKSPFRKYIFRLRLNLLDSKRLFSYTTMLLISALAFPVVEIIIRLTLINASGLSDAGLWQGAIRLSGAYLGFFSVFFAYYLTPLISPEQDKKVIRRTVIFFLICTASVYAVGASTFYIFRQYLIPLFLSKDFSPLSDVIVYQLIGDFFRILSYVMGFVAVAKAATKLYILSEVFQSLGFLSLSIFFSQYTSPLQGVFWGYLTTYIIYFTLSLFVFLRWSRV